MNRLQAKLLQLAVEFDSICRKHGIRYYLSGGSNLGALRHGGFIPWDDDLDIRMPRGEYEKLEAIIDAELSEGRQLVSTSRFETYNSPIPRYVDLTSTCLAFVRMDDETPHGIFLDLIILDPIPRDPVRQHQWKKDHYAYCELTEYVKVTAARKSDWESVDISGYSAWERRAGKVGRKQVIRELEDRLFSIDEEEADEYCMRFGSTWLGITPVEWYGQPRDVEFEGHRFCAARKAELCAWSNYGPGWKYIPGLSGRQRHQTLKLEDVAAGNCEREYMSLIDKPHFVETVKGFRRPRLEWLDYEHCRFMEISGPYIAFLQHRLRARIDELGEGWIREHTQESLPVFQEFMNLQLRKEYCRNGCCFPLDEEVLDLLTCVCLAEDRVGDLSCILGLRKQAGETLNVYQMESLRFCEDMLEMMKALDLAEYEEAAAYIERHQAAYRDQRSLVKGKMQLLIHRARLTGGLEVLTEYVEYAGAQFPGDAEVMKYRGDAAALQGQDNCAHALYEEAAEKLTNGIMLRELAAMGITGAIRVIEGLRTEAEKEEE